MVPSGESSLTQPWRLCTPPLKVSPTLWRVMGRRARSGVTPWTQQNPLYMLRLGSDIYVIVIALSVIVSAHHVHMTFSHLLTSPLSFLVVSHRLKMKVQSTRTPGSTVMVGGKNTHTNRYPRVYHICTMYTNSFVSCTRANGALWNLPHTFSISNDACSCMPCQISHGSCHSYLNCTHDLAGCLPGVGMVTRPKSATELFEWFDSGYQEQVGLSSGVS